MRDTAMQLISIATDRRYKTAQDAAKELAGRFDALAAENTELRTEKARWQARAEYRQLAEGERDAARAEADRLRRENTELRGDYEDACDELAELRAGLARIELLTAELLSKGVGSGDRYFGEKIRAALDGQALDFASDENQSPDISKPGNDAASNEEQ